MTQVNTTPTLTNEKILQGAVLTGVINAVINGAIQIYFLWGNTTIPLSVDGITNDSHTVFGSAVPLAVSLAMILTVVAYMTIKVPKQPFFPSVLWLTFKHGMFAFGLCVTGAVIWQSPCGCFRERRTQSGGMDSSRASAHPIFHQLHALRVLQCM